MISPSSIRTVFMGTPEFAVQTLDMLVDYGLNLVGVYTQPDRPKGRGKQLAPPPVKECAQKHAIPVFQPQKLRAPEVVAELAELKPDLIVVVAYGQILPKSVLDLPQYGCINVHASLLPRYRGAAPINQAIVDGEVETGITTMNMDVGLDTGDMLVKKSLAIGPEETAGELHDRLALLGAETMRTTLDLLVRGELRPEKQEDALSTYAPMMKKEDGAIDWTLPAPVIHNRVRGLSPWPGAYTGLHGEVVKIASTRPAKGSGEPGEILSATPEGVLVACGSGALLVGALQLPGKKMMPVGDFLRGRTLPTGEKFVKV